MLTPNLMLIEMPRTGGTMFRNVLRQLSCCCDPPEWGQHTNYRKMAAHAQQISIGVPPAVVFARHPRTWYLSAWCYTAKNAPEFRGISFGDYLELVAPTTPSRHLLRRTFTEIWNWLGADQATFFYKYENLYGGIRDVIRKTMGDRIDDYDVRLLLAQQKRSRASRVYPAWELLSGYNPEIFWTDEMRARVSAWDGQLMERFRYEW